MRVRPLRYLNRQVAMATDAFRTSNALPDFLIVVAWEGGVA